GPRVAIIDVVVDVVICPHGEEIEQAVVRGSRRRDVRRTTYGVPAIPGAPIEYRVVDMVVCPHAKEILLAHVDCRGRCKRGVGPEWWCKARPGPGDRPGRRVLRVAAVTARWTRRAIRALLGIHAAWATRQAHQVRAIQGLPIHGGTEHVIDRCAVTVGKD